MDYKINKVNKIKGSISLPGDKSISHRALIIGSLCHGEVLISNFLEAADTMSTMSCLKALGVEINSLNGNYLLKGVGKKGFKKPTATLNAGNSGTTMRILPAILSAQNFSSEITGDNSLKKRPMNRVIDPLSEMGANIRSTNGYPPLTIEGRQLSGTTYELPVASAQVKTAVMLAGLLANGSTTVIERLKSRDHTERMLQYFGADFEVNREKLTVHGTSELIAKPIEVPGDISSGAFFIAATLLVPNSSLLVKKVGVNSTRTGFLEALKQMNANFTLENENIINNEPVADIFSRAQELRATTICRSLIPLLIDELPIIAVLATQAHGTTVVSDAAELRVKESDRIKNIVSELKKLGANIEEKEDGFVVNGPTKLRGAKVNSYGDHRMAMSMAIAGLIADGPTIIENFECVDISFPGFKKMLKEIS